MAVSEILPRNEGGNGTPARRKVPFQKAAHSLKRSNDATHEAAAQGSDAAARNDCLRG